MRKNVARILIILLCAPIFLPSSAEAGSHSWYAQILPKEASIGFTANEDISTDMRTESWIVGVDFGPKNPADTSTADLFCTTMKDEKCAETDSIAINAILPPCQLASSSDCVEGMSFKKDGSPAIAAELVGERATSYTPGYAELDVPVGGSISTWRVPGATNSLNNDLYAVNVHMEFQNFKNPDCQDLSKCIFALGTFSADVVPIKVESYTATNICLWTTKTECGATGTFPEKTRISLSLRISNNLTGFLFGRMEDIDVEVNTFNKNLNRLRVEGYPIDIPGIYAFTPKSSISSHQKIDKFWKSWMPSQITSILESPDTYNPGPWPRFALPYAIAYENEVKTSHIVKSVWKFGNGFGTGIGSPCFAKKDALLGIVSTNAAVYSPDPPTFRNGFLDFQVAGAHYLDDGKTLTKGTYDLAVTSDFARCLYGFKDAPIQATVSITSQDSGEQNIATEIVRQDKAKKWVFLSAKNFTFSSPVIKVKLTQAGTQSNSPSATAKNRSITCVKGTSKKKVIGSSPKCPAGFKKVA